MQSPLDFLTQPKDNNITPSTSQDSTSQEPLTPNLPLKTITIVSIAQAAAYHEVSENAIYVAIRKGKLQHVKGIPAHQLDNYKPDRLNQARGRKRLDK